MSAVSIYSHDEGLVKVIPNEGLPMLVGLYGILQTGQEVQSAYGFLTNVQGENNVGHQFMHTLRNFVYVYVFGERMGILNVGGKAITRNCGATGSDSYGLAVVSAFYDDNRLSNAIYTPAEHPVVIVNIGSDISITGFLTKLQMQITDPDSPFADFTMTINTMH
jgi:hypothetical protein